MATYDPNMALAQKVGGALAGLFAPPDHTRQMKYMVGASQINENNAQADHANAQAKLTNQSYDNRAVFTPENVAAAFKTLQNNPGMARLVAASLGQGGNAAQAVQGLNAAMGGQRIANATDEGDARVGYALTGHDAAATAPLTGGGIADLFKQQTAIQDSKNQTDITKQGMADSTSRANNAATNSGKRWNVNGALLDASGAQHGETIPSQTGTNAATKFGTLPATQLAVFFPASDPMSPVPYNATKAAEAQTNAWNAGARTPQQFFEYLTTGKVTPTATAGHAAAAVENPPTAPAPAAPGGIAQPTTQAQYDALPPGTLYRDAAGNTRRKS